MSAEVHERPLTFLERCSHFLAPTVIELLRKRRVAQARDRLALGGEWQTQIFNGTPIDLVFTTGSGGLIARQTVVKAVQSSARHRDTYRAEEVVDLADIARHVGVRLMSLGRWYGGAARG